MQAQISHTANTEAAHFFKTTAHGPRSQKSRLIDLLLKSENIYIYASHVALLALVPFNLNIINSFTTFFCEYVKENFFADLTTSINF